MTGLVKPKTYNIADSNLALFGSKLEHDVKKAAANKEPAWDNAGKEVGLLIWRIEKFHVKPWPKEQYGSFYSGDSYIILNTYKEPGKNEMKYTVFFWLGDHTTQDEAGTAAYKTVELDDKLPSHAVQHREVMGSESAEFVKLFPKGVKTMEGGIETGFHHVTPVEYKPRLLQIRPVGHHVAASQVDFHAKSFNADDCYIVDMGLKVYQWAGPKANHMERSKSMEMAHHIKDDRHGKAEIVVCTHDDDKAMPWDKLGGKPNPLPAAPADPPLVPKKLLKVGRKAPFAAEVVKTGNLTRNLLDGHDAFIVDDNATVYVWVGRQTPMDEKKKALQIGADYLKSANKPPTTTLVRVVQDAENELFLSLFD